VCRKRIGKGEGRRNLYGVPTIVVFETHSWSEDNDRGIATGWLPGRLSDRGRVLAGQLGERRRSDGLAAVFTSDLYRAVEMAEVAFGCSGLPVLADWRLRECNYGQLNGADGESWEQAIAPGPLVPL
jgi:2,3-bisphosphoglycerate-dependent phosphoglycerate mutase